MKIGIIGKDKDHKYTTLKAYLENQEKRKMQEMCTHLMDGKPFIYKGRCRICGKIIEKGELNYV